MSIEFVHELARPWYATASNQARRCLVRSTATGQHYMIETQQISTGHHAWAQYADERGVVTDLRYIFSMPIPRCKMIELLETNGSR